MRARAVRYLTILVLLAATLVQAQWLIGRWGGQAVIRIAGELQSPVWLRSAEYLRGPRFAAYIEFIRASTPANARIVIPPRLPERAESNVGLMQYFLFPRDIHNCGVNEVEQCIQRIGGALSYILALDDFPPRALAELTRQYIAFDESIGIYAPP